MFRTLNFHIQTFINNDLKLIIEDLSKMGLDYDIIIDTVGNIYTNPNTKSLKDQKYLSIILVKLNTRSALTEAQNEAIRIVHTSYDEYGYSFNIFPKFISDITGKKVFIAQHMRHRTDLEIALERECIKFNEWFSEDGDIQFIDSLFDDYRSYTREENLERSKKLLVKSEIALFPKNTRESGYNSGIFEELLCAEANKIPIKFYE